MSDLDGGLDGLDAELVRALDALAGRDPLLVALDFDGVCAPLVDDPSTSQMLPVTRTALLALQAAGVVVALVSGRDLAGLTAVADPAPQWLLVGSHGAEVAGGPVRTDGGEAGRVDESLEPSAVRVLHDVTDAVAEVVASHPGTRAERKPTGVVLHTRLADATTADAAVKAVMADAGSREGVRVRRGHDVVELAVSTADKGTAVQALRRSTGAAAVLFAGDDVTDEDALALLDPAAGDVGIKVGDQDTVAAHRVASPTEVTRLLHHLLAARLTRRVR